MAAGKAPDLAVSSTTGSWLLLPRELNEDDVLFDAAFGTPVCFCTAVKRRRHAAYFIIHLLASLSTMDHCHTETLLNPSAF